MEREIDMNEVSDGRFYTANDLVKADCGGCRGCSSCCRGMGSSITLDPLDVHRLCAGLAMGFMELLDRYVELNIVDGLILPNLKMAGEDAACAFLNREGRCSIHAIRPGICRLFPLGRFYEHGTFRYFLQVHECPKPKTKIRVRKWVDEPEFERYEQFIRDWHYYLKSLQRQVEAEPEQMKPMSMGLLNRFYLMPYRTDKEFYSEFYDRISKRK